MISCVEYVEFKKIKLKEKISQLAKKPYLCVVQIGNDASSNSYIKSKENGCKEVGIDMVHINIDEDKVSEPELVKKIKELDNNDNIDGIIIQLPVPNKYNIKTLQQCISSEKDVDGFRNDSCFKPCTPKGIVDWLEYNNYDFNGKNAVVIGRSNIVGKPLVNMLIDKGATVTCCNSKTKSLKSFTYNADIIVSAIGKAKFFNEMYFNNPEIIIDVGINRDENNKLCGDIDKASVEVSLSETYITPVPNGVGKLTVYSLLENVVKACELNIAN